MPLARLLLAQELVRCLIQLLPGHLDVALRGLDLGMTDELPSFFNVFSCFVELSCLRHSEVVAFDSEAVLLEELCQHLRPLVCRVTSIAAWEHYVSVARANLVLICFDCIDCFLINHDRARTRFFADDTELTVAISVGLDFSDLTEGQTNGILYAERTSVQESDQREDFR